MEIKCWKYLSEGFSRDVAGDSRWGKKCNWTVRRPKNKKQQGRRRKRRDRFHVARKTRGKAEREVCEETALLTQTPAKAEQIQLCPPIRLPTSAPLPRERGHNSMRKEKKTRRQLVRPPCGSLFGFICCCWVSSQSSMFNTSMGVGTKC